MCAGPESSPVTRILGDDPDDFLGGPLSGLAFGDIDGFDDAIIGAWSADRPGVGISGEVYEIFGRASLRESLST